jgi:lysophospholipase L1-like esterase
MNVKGASPSRFSVTPQRGSVVVLGDSIALETWGNYLLGFPTVFPTLQFRNLVQAAYGHLPTVYNAAVNGTTSADGLAAIDALLAGSTSPGINVVVLAFGTNDAGNGVSDATFLSNMTSMIAKVVAAGKTPVVPKIMYASADPWHTNIPAKNTVIANSIWGVLPGVVAGPDLWTLVSAHPEYLAGDGIHLTVPGCDFVITSWKDSLAWAYAY